MPNMITPAAFARPAISPAAALRKRLRRTMVNRVRGKSGEQIVIGGDLLK